MYTRRPFQLLLVTIECNGSHLFIFYYLLFTSCGYCILVKHKYRTFLWIRMYTNSELYQCSSCNTSTGTIRGKNVARSILSSILEEELIKKCQKRKGKKDQENCMQFYDFSIFQIKSVLGTNKKQAFPLETVDGISSHSVNHWNNSCSESFFYSVERLLGD